ncbi:MAG: hypothetical protein BMS9Abin23_0534 [Thermodesulfobacteriota bacterium]|nr:MAG: hypothetical protein BMS9Abin23_0534 [Thermodesulfobacteriota bacterium]
MSGFVRFFSYALAVVLALSGAASAAELSGWAEVEGRYFPEGPLYRGQESESVSVALRPEFYGEWAGDNSFTFVPFYRYDSADTQRTHFDIREAMFLKAGESYEFRAGVGKVFWGVTEANHLVDIINQTDLVESIDGEEKLGQPMVDLTLLSRYGTWDIFVLPYFRERTFPGRAARLRFDPFIDSDLGAAYESGDEERHVDFALRYSNTVGDWDVGVSYFYGTSRDPAYLPRTGTGASFVPFYEIIHQGGLDVQYVKGGWLWKLEGIYRTGYRDGGYYALDAGFEYTFSGPAFYGMDVGLLLEYLYDSRNFDFDLNGLVDSGYISSRFNTFMNNDYMLGLRVAVNDAASSEILIVATRDADNGAAVVKIESSRRIGDNWKAELDGYLFVDAGKDPLLDFFRKDGFVQASIRYYF